MRGPGRSAAVATMRSPCRSSAVTVVVMVVIAPIRVDEGLNHHASDETGSRTSTPAAAAAHGYVVSVACHGGRSAGAKSAAADRNDDDDDDERHNYGSSDCKSEYIECSEASSSLQYGITYRSLTALSDQGSRCRCIGSPYKSICSIHASSNCSRCRTFPRSCNTLTHCRPPARDRCATSWRIQSWEETQGRLERDAPDLRNRCRASTQQLAP